MALGTSYDTLPAKIYVNACMQPPPEGNPYPWDCQYMEVDSSIFQPQSAGPTKEQYDAIFGAVLAIVALVIAFGLIKKAIEQ
jgi:hypothetical protein